MKTFIMAVVVAITTLAMATACSRPAPAATTLPSSAPTSTAATPPASPPPLTTTPPAATSEATARQSPSTTGSMTTPTPTSSGMTGNVARSGTIVDSDITENGKRTLRQQCSYYYSGGSIQGTIVQKDVTEILENGKLTSTAEGTFTGTVDAKKGTLSVRATADGQVSNAVGTFTARYDILSGTDELAGLRGTIDLRASFSPAFFWGTYSANFAAAK